MEGFLTKGQRGATAVLRIATGLVFLTAGIDKAIIAGKAFDASGFLSHATGGTPVLGAAVGWRDLQPDPRPVGQPREQRRGHAGHQLAGRRR